MIPCFVAFPDGSRSNITSLFLFILLHYFLLHHWAFGTEFRWHIAHETIESWQNRRVPNVFTSPPRLVTKLDLCLTPFACEFSDNSDSRRQFIPWTWNVGLRLWLWNAPALFWEDVVCFQVGFFNIPYCHLTGKSILVLFPIFGFFHCFFYYF